MAGDVDALDLHAIGRLVLSTGIGPRWKLSEHARTRGSATVVDVLDESQRAVGVELWDDGGPSTGGARRVAERFVDELEHAGFKIVRAR